MYKHIDLIVYPITIIIVLSNKWFTFHWIPYIRICIYNCLTNTINNLSYIFMYTKKYTTGIVIEASSAPTEYIMNTVWTRDSENTAQHTKSYDPLIEFLMNRVSYILSVLFVRYTVHINTIIYSSGTW